MTPVEQEVPFSLPGTLPATAANYGFIFTNPFDIALELIGGFERHETLGTDGGAVTLAIHKAASGTAKGSSTAMSDTVNLKGTVDTNQSIVPHATFTNRILLPGESVLLKLAGTPTSVAGLCGTLLFRPVSP